MALSVYRSFRRAARNPLALLLVATVSAVSLAVPGTPAAAAEPEPIRYSYDDAGRLTGVTDPATDTATYAYDQVGNVTGISRRPSQQVSVQSVVPSRGAPGTSVTITGTGFAATTGANEVTFAGTSATVTSASSTQLVVTVPSGAATGAVAVTTASGTATGPQPFTVETPAAPTVTGFTPTSGASGTEVTITGTGFDADPAGNVVLFNNAARARVTTATATKLTVLAPTTGAGRISVRTKNGMATSGDTFATAPGKYSLANVETSTKLDIDGAAQTATVGTAGKVALLRFDGEQGQRLSLALTGKTFSGRVTARFYTSVGVELSTNEVNDPYYITANTSLELPILPATGTYQVVLDPAGGTGAVTATLSKDLDAGALSETGTGTAISISRPGQRVRLHIAGTSGRQYAIAITDSTGTGSNRVGVYWPDGLAEVASTTFSSGNGTLATGALPASADFQVVIDVPTAITRSFTVTLSVPADFGVLSATGAATTVTTTRPGQRAVLRFDAAQGTLFSLGLTASTYSSTVGVAILQPGGATLGTYSVSGASNEVDPPAAPVAGTYQVLLTPSGITTGSVTVTLATDVDAGMLDPAVAGTTATTTRPGQNVRLRFNGTVGQRLSLGLTGSTYGGTYRTTVYRPDGTANGNTLILSGDGQQDQAALTAAGTYEVVIDPNAPLTGSVTVTLSTEVDAGALSLTGAGSTVAVARPGQNARVRFDGSVGQRLSLGSTGSTFGGLYFLTVLRPDGTTQVSNQAMSSSNDELDLAPLTIAGTYEAVLDFTTRTGSVTVTLSAEADGGSLSLTGTASTVSISRAGQDIRVRFDGAVGQQLSLGSTGSTLGGSYYLTVIRPDGTTQVSNESMTSGNDDLDLVPLTVAGTYEAVLDPTGARTGSVTVTLSAELDGGVLSPTGTASTVSIARPGQNVRLRFDGTVGQHLSLGKTGSTLGTSSYLTLLRPDATTQLNNQLVSSSDDEVDFATLTVAGTYEVVFNPLSAGSGTVTFTLAVDVDGGSLTVGGAATTVTIARAGQNARLRFDGTVGQTLTVTFSGTTLTSIYYVSVLRPDGTAQVNPKALSGNTSLAVGALTVAGTHEVVIDPITARTGAITVALTTTTTTTTTTTAAAAATAAGATDAIAAQRTGGLWGLDLTPYLGKPVAKSSTPDGGGKTTQSGAQPDQKSQPDQNKPGARPVAGVSAHVADGGWMPDKANLAGMDWWTRQPKPASAPPALTAKRGVTALAGLVRSIDGRPLGGVALRVDEVRTTSREDGRFLLTQLPAGHHELIVEANGVGRPAADYGHFVMGVDLADAHTTVLPYTIWLTKLDRAQMVRFPSPTTGEVVLTTPKIPGLEVRIPAGDVVRDDKGQVVRELGITAIPTDRPPFPLPSQIHVPVYFTVQPGGSYLFPQGAQVIYPNYNHEAPGTRVEFWNYEPAGRGWYVYGHGSVTADGRQVVPDKDVRVYEFNGSMINSGLLTGPDTGPNQDYRGWGDGDPVDLGTGLLVDTHTDLFLPDVMPISMTRTYRQADSAVRPFGIGQNFDYGIFLHTDDATNEYQHAELVLPDGGKVRYSRTSAGTGFHDAVYRNDDSASEWYRSTITWRGNGWNLTTRDGTTYVFGEMAPLQAIRDRHGNQITITRAGAGDDAQLGNITQITSPNGKWIRLSYDSSSRITRAEDNAGRAVGYVYDTAGWLKSVTDVAGKVTTYGYDSDKRLTTITDPRGITYLTNTYDSAGRIARQVMPEGSVYQFAYTTGDNGRINETKVTDPNGHVRRVTLNADGFVTSETAAFGTDKAQTKTLERQTGTNWVTRLTDQRGRSSTFGYDAAGNVTSVTVLDGTSNKITSSTVYGGPFNQVSKVTDALGHSTNSDYDGDGNLRQVTDAAGRSVTFTHRPDGRVATTTDPLGKTTTFGYELGDLVSTTDPLGRVSRQTGDAAGRVVASTDPSGATQRFVYDERNLLISVTDPLGQTTSFGYDESGNRLTRTDPRDHTTTWTYDEADRIKTTTDPLGKTTSNTYDANGNPRTSTDRTGKVTRADYDELDRLVTAAYGVSGSTSESTITYSYDSGNRVTKVVDSAAGTITQQPDELDRLVSQSTPQGTVTYGYDDAGRRRSMQVAGQPAVTYSYNDADQLTSLVKGNQTVAIGYDGAGRPKTRTMPGGASQTSDYDDANQLTGITYTRGSATLGTLTYTYDAAGRRTSVGGSYARTDIPDAFTGATYNAADQLTALGGKTFSYDDEGNLTGDGTTSYTWNARGQLSAMARTGLSAAFTYDALGRRATKTVNSVTTGYLYDGDTEVQELSGTSPTVNLLTGGTDVHYARTDATGDHDVLTDALNSVVGLTDAAGNVATKYTYDPFGATTSDGAASDNAVQYTGRENDGTGLYYYRARYYNPALQRFISQDPAGSAGGDNLYAYAANSPTNFTDPSGNFAFLVVLAGEFLIGALVDAAISYGTQTLSGRKVDWGWHGVLGDALFGGLINAATAGLGRGFTLADEVGDVARFCRRHSFTPDTHVQMADGTTKPIGEVSVGDEVLATDPTTGQTGPREVTDVIVGTGPKDLVDLTIDGQAVTVTAGHPFYDATRHTWVDANELQPGEVLRGTAGPVVVDKVKAYSLPDQTVYNLTIADLHTYYVLAGQTAVLVHNDNGGSLPGREEARLQAMRMAGIPVDAEPIDTLRNASGVQYVYDLDGKYMLLTENTMDRSHPGEPHWEAGPAKPGLQVDNYGRYRVSNQKFKVNFSAEAC
jgi:RHS repeat-associated protein